MKVKKPVQEVEQEVEAPVRKYNYVGAVNIIKIRELVIHTTTITDAEIDMFLTNYPRLADYFKLN